MARVLVISALLLLAGCGPAMMQNVLLNCLQKCSNGDAACITACGNLLKADCR
jgi:hypothetical protein